MIEADVTLFLVRIVPPFLLVLGTFGNLVSAVVLRKRPMRLLPTCLYFFVLAAADTFVLWVGCFHFWLSDGFGLNLFERTTVTCRISKFALYVSSDYSAWLLAAVSIERFNAW